MCTEGTGSYRRLRRAQRIRSKRIRSKWIRSQKLHFALQSALVKISRKVLPKPKVDLHRRADVARKCGAPQKIVSFQFPLVARSFALILNLAYVKIRDKQ
ncbi:hypothetical protein DBV15_05020 [Temnothorax longispinosus]|uniref:Uncharacterized protein n=1 Tax=Temnothorax longispinosus TaxID=300112 RepID=A0A4S2KN98_9HYME|nr:hypothetical protein DBV15_05020 [Temnothorax longispinosus]